MRTLLLLMLCACHANGTELHWHEFDVGVSDHLGFGKERVALLLRAKINGADCWVQLDTGASGDLLWHRRRGAAEAERPLTVALQIGDMRRQVLADAANLAPLEQPQPGVPVATVGNAFFEHGTLSLDLGEERFAFTPGAALAGNPRAQPMRYLQSGGPGGHPLVQAALANGKRGEVLLDTGSARFGLVATSAARWAELSGGQALRKGSGVREFSVSNAKDAAPFMCYETLAAGAMRVGGQTLTGGMLSYCEGKDFALARPLLGVLGLQPLGKRRITLDYVSQRWLLGD